MNHHPLNLRESTDLKGSKGVNHSVGEEVLEFGSTMVYFHTDGIFWEKDERNIIVHERTILSPAVFMEILRCLVKIAPKRTTKSTQVPPVTPAPTATTTTVTEAQLQALSDQGVAAAMAEAEASRVRNGYGSNGSGPRLAQAILECTYPDFLKCKWCLFLLGNDGGGVGIVGDRDG
nr:hypothetical protein [Tanacetum cinerariifolium]